jgi:hypothetical protein
VLCGSALAALPVGRDDTDPPETQVSTRVATGDCNCCVF